MGWNSSNWHAANWFRGYWLGNDGDAPAPLTQGEWITRCRRRRGR